MDIDKCAEIFAGFAGKRLYCGWSGGADSMAALLVARHFSTVIAFELTAIHFNHHLRGAESDGDARFAADFARNQGIDFRCIDLTLDPAQNVESAARQARLAAYKKFVQTGEAVVLGHHLDDRAENFLLRATRGGNLSSLLSPRPVSVVDGVTFIRPLLDFSRAEMEEFVKDYPWRTDSSNLASDYKRNFIRNQMLKPLFDKFPESRAGLYQTLEVLADDADFMESEAELRYLEIANLSKTPLGFWQELPPALLVRVLRKFTNVIVSRDTVKRLKLALAAGGSNHIPVNDATAIVIKSGELFLAQPAMADFDILWDWQNCPRISAGPFDFTAEAVAAMTDQSLSSAYFDWDTMPAILRLRPPADGDRIIPFGRQKPVLLKKLRIDRKLDRADSCVVEAENEVIFAPGIRHGRYAPAEPGKRILRITCHASK